MRTIGPSTLFKNCFAWISLTLLPVAATNAADCSAIKLSAQRLTCWDNAHQEALLTVKPVAAPRCNEFEKKSNAVLDRFELGITSQEYRPVLAELLTSYRECQSALGTQLSQDRSTHYNRNIQAFMVQADIWAAGLKWCNQFADAHRCDWGKFGGTGSPLQLRDFNDAAKTLISRYSEFAAASKFEILDTAEKIKNSMFTLVVRFDPQR